MLPHTQLHSTGPHGGTEGICSWQSGRLLHAEAVLALQYEAQPSSEQYAIGDEVYVIVKELATPVDPPRN